MKISNAILGVIATRRSQYPTEELPEFLLVGRSNVGKSSFINTVLEKKNLARVSATPGKTQTLNFYLANNSFYLVDVPGYGYASVNKEQQRKFGLMIEEYLEKRAELKRVFMIIDFRLKPTENDVLMYQFLKYYNIPVCVIATKMDKLKNSELVKNKKAIIAKLGLAENDEFVATSSETKKGIEETLNIIENSIK